MIISSRIGLMQHLMVSQQFPPYESPAPFSPSDISRSDRHTWSWQSCDILPLSWGFDSHQAYLITTVKIHALIEEAVPQLATLLTPDNRFTISRLMMMV
jgi:hypothetical protein